MLGIQDVISQLNNASATPEIDKSSIAGLIAQLDDTHDVVELPKSLVKNYAKIGMKPNEWSLFCLIEAFISEGKEVPNQNELAELMGMTPRNIQVIISDLKSKGLLETKVIKRDNKTVYNFNNLKRKAWEIERFA